MSLLQALWHVFISRHLAAKLVFALISVSSLYNIDVIIVMGIRMQSINAMKWRMFSDCNGAHGFTSEWS